MKLLRMIKRIISEPSPVDPQKKHIRDKAYIYTTFFFMMCTFYNCNLPDKHSGFVLIEFAIDDDRLQAIVDSVIEMHLPILHSDEEKSVMSLNLTKKDTALLFIFSLRKEEELMNRYIFRENKRILGYTNSSAKEVILLSDIDHLSDLGREFGRFIHPTRNTKSFDYMRFPENLYDGWPNFELIYDPTYIIYTFVDNKFSRPMMTTNPNIDQNVTELK